MRKFAAVLLVLVLVAFAAHAQSNAGADLGSLIDALKKSQGNSALDMGQLKRMIGQLNRMNASPGSLNNSGLGYAGFNENFTEGAGGADMAQLLFIADAGKRIQSMMSGKDPSDKRYYVPTEQLALMFDAMTKNLDPEARQRMTAGRDDALASRIISSLAGREKARLRNEEVMKFMILPDSALDAEVSDMLFRQVLNGSNQTVEDDSVIRGVLDGMDPAFKRKFTYMAVNGSLEDRATLKDVISGYSSTENRALSAELFDRIGKGNIEDERIREILRENGDLDDIMKTLWVTGKR
jgi:hypothetical protein